MGQNDFFDENGNIWGSYESYQNSYSGDALYNDWAKNPITDASSSSTNKAQAWWDKNGQFIMDGAGNILDAVTKIVVATNGSYDPNQYYTGPNGYVQYNPYYSRRSSGMSATTKIVLFGALGAAIIVGAVLYKKSKRKKRREEREREEEYEYHRRTSKRRRR